MLKKVMALALLLEVALVGFGASASAEGVVQSASKDVAKGAIKGMQQELNSGTVVEGAKQVSKSMLDGVSAAVPTMTSQFLNQAERNRKAIGNVARALTQQAVSGALTTSTREMEEALGKNGDGPLAVTMAATSEKITAAMVRGIVSSIPPADPATMEKLGAAAMRGAMSEAHLNVNFPVGTFVLAFVLGGFSTLLCGFGLMLLYMLFQKRRVVEVATTPVVRAQQPAMAMR